MEFFKNFVNRETNFHFVAASGQPRARFGTKAVPGVKLLLVAAAWILSARSPEGELERKGEKDGAREVRGRLERASTSSAGRLGGPTPGPELGRDLACSRVGGRLRWRVLRWGRRGPRVLALGQRGTACHTILWVSAPPLDPSILHVYQESVPLCQHPRPATPVNGALRLDDGDEGGQERAGATELVEVAQGRGKEWGEGLPLGVTEHEPIHHDEIVLEIVPEILCWDRIYQRQKNWSRVTAGVRFVKAMLAHKLRADLSNSIYIQEMEGLQTGIERQGNKARGLSFKAVAGGTERLSLCWRSSKTILARNTGIRKLEQLEGTSETTIRRIGKEPNNWKDSSRPSKDLNTPPMALDCPTPHAIQKTLLEEKTQRPTAFSPVQ
ncbi:hypothetical protein BS47DRAFT_1366512 [Hydnum rufescens UP504]|uniref:Uncharacterized protein n=1 Tax=Hydnum rufescens UP504 TaxID=1448309 RepID=A0A9P6AKU6_9AGAM|nr:hypothetical protein BS47DRAFT_1366512 [Hydnum rufescens UP504]